MKYKYKKLILKLYLYRYLKYCLNPVKFNLYYQLITFISKILFEIGKPITFLKKKYHDYYDYRRFLRFYSYGKEKQSNGEILDKEDKIKINLETIVSVHINSRIVKITYHDLIYLIYTFLQSQDLVDCEKQLILNHPTLSDCIKKLMIDIPYFRSIDFIEYASDQANYEDEEVPIEFNINHYFNLNDPMDKRLIFDWILFGHNESRSTYLSFHHYYFYSILLEESNQSSFYINIYKNQVHHEIIRFIKFFYTYFKFVFILVIANFLFGFAAAKLLISLFLLYGFFIILKRKRYILFLKRIWILFLFSIGYSLLSLSISIPLLNLIVSFLILKTIYFIVVNIGSISYKLNYPKYTFINWLYRRYWIKLESFLERKRSYYRYRNKNKEKELFYNNLLLWLESIEKREETLLRTQK